MKPYYSDDAVTLYHGDCREILPHVRADACITDPPYNVGIRYGVGTNDSRADYALWCAEWFCLLEKSVTGPIAVSCGVANIGVWTAIRQPTWIMAWHKPAAMGRCAVGFNNWEPIIVYGKPVGQIVDVIRAPLIPSDEMEGHPCPKPMEWAAKQIAAFVPPGGTVIDCFAGSGTMLKAAKNMNRRVIGIEIEERYCAIAATRLSQNVLDLGGAA